MFLKLIRYKDIPIGNCFKDDEFHYMKCKCLDENYEDYYPAVELETGLVFEFEDNDLVEPIDY